MMRTTKEYHDKLFAMRANIYIGGEKVGRDNHRLKPGINVMDITFNLAQDPEYEGLATAVPEINLNQRPGKITNRICMKLPLSASYGDSPTI